jgi:hypothetical protein
MGDGHTLALNRNDDLIERNAAIHMCRPST